MGTEWTSFNNELCEKGRIRDANGPYLTKAVEDRGANPTLYGPSRNELLVLRQFFGQCCQRTDLDVIITTGGVFIGGNDLVRSCLSQTDHITIYYTDISIRPGQSMIFATYNPPSTPSRVMHGYSPDTTHHYRRPPKPKAIFALPGAPVAAAACRTFFVIPFLSRLTQRRPAAPLKAFVRDVASHQEMRKAAHALGHKAIVMFHHGTLSRKMGGGESVRHPDQATYMTSAFAESNAWVVVGAEGGDCGS
jgi:AP-1 complex subunit mu